MDLWIRSQDKTTLIKSYEIYVSEYGKDSYIIRAKRTSHILGAYKTNERALEILDEIQDLFITRELKTEFTKDGLTIMKEQPSSVVYEMPEE